MATLMSARFGEISYDFERVISFPDGLLGFEDFTEYVVLDIKGRDFPFRWLQSLKEDGPVFLVFDPSSRFPWYWPVVAKDDLLALGLHSLDEAIVVCVVTVPHDPAKMTANFQSPIIINSEKRLGRQVVTGLPSYKIRQSLIDGAPNKTGVLSRSKREKDVMGETPNARSDQEGRRKHLDRGQHRDKDTPSQRVG